MAKSEWVCVRSESELRPGMAIRLAYDGFCENDFVFDVVKTDGNEPCSPLRMMCPSNTRLRTYGGEPMLPWCPWEWIQDGDLYRLRDLDEADETTEVAKELEVTRG